MLKDTKRPNGTIKRVQYVYAPRGGVSSMGTRYVKGDPILHLSSSRCTGETFVLLPREIERTLYRAIPTEIDVGGCKRPGRFASPKDWAVTLRTMWEKEFVKEHGHAINMGCKDSCPEHFSDEGADNA